LHSFAGLLHSFEKYINVDTVLTIGVDKNMKIELSKFGTTHKQDNLFNL